MPVAGLISQRAGYKAAITRFLVKNDDEIDSESLASLIKKVSERHDKILALDLKIMEELTTDAQDMEDEMVNAADYEYEMELTINKLKRKLKTLQTSETLGSDHTSHGQQDQDTTSVSTHPFLHSSTLGTSHSTGAQDRHTVSREVIDHQLTNAFDPFETQSPSHSRSRNAPQTPSRSRPEDEIDQSYANIRLPRVELPTFDGEPTTWQTFWDTYQPSIHVNSRIPAVEKFTRLLMLLSGEARSCVAGFAITAANYQRAVELLTERFGQPHLIIQSHMNALINLSPPYDDLTSLQNYYDCVETHIRGLESLGLSQSQYGALLTPVIINNLPQDVRQTMARTNGGSDWTLLAIRNQLKRELEIRRSAVPTTSTPASVYVTQSASRPQSSRAENRWNNQTRRDIRCVFCSDAHSAGLCPNITDITRRKQIVQTKRLCYNCLSSRHPVTRCTSWHKCRHCESKHHTSLCTNTGNTSPPTANGNQTDAPVSSVSSESSSASSNFVQLMEMDQMENSVINMTVPTNGQGVLLSTAVTPIKIGDEMCEANVLFDLGAQRSFVSEAFLRKLNAKPADFECITMSGIESSSGKYRRLPRIDLTVQTIHTDDVRVPALVLKNIAAPLNVKNSEVRRMPHLKGLKLAHPVSADGLFNIDVLIAADRYWDIVQDKTIRGNGPTAIQSKVGYLLSGPIKCHNQASSSTQETPIQIHTGLTLVNEIPEIRDDHQYVLQTLDQFWKLESLRITPKVTSTDTELREAYQQQILDKVGEKYKARPWKEIHRKCRLPSLSGRSTDTRNFRQ